MVYCGIIMNLVSLVCVFGKNYTYRLVYRAISNDTVFMTLFCDFYFHEFWRNLPRLLAVAEDHWALLSSVFSDKCNDVSEI